MTQAIEVPFGEWLPDAPDFKNPGLIVAKNCYPSVNGYFPFWAGEAGSAAVTGTILGAKRFERTDGSEITCVGTDTDLWVIVGGTATASSLSLTSIDIQENWSFEQFGTAIYATIKSIDADGRKSYYLTDLDSDTSFSASPGSPPAGNALARIDDFLVYGDIEDIDSSDGHTRIRWSAFNNPQTTWGTDIATQQDYFDLPTHLGKVTGIAGGSVGYIMQKHGTSVFDYTGTSSAFQRVLLEGTEDQSAGCEGHASIASVGGVHYFLSNIGFCKLTGGGIQVISKNRIWDWFLENANTDKLHKVQAAINFDRRSVVWNFYQVDTTAYNMQIIYCWETDSWSYSTVTVDWLVPTVYTGSFSAGDPRIKRILGGFVSGTWTEYSGATLEAVLETGEFQLVPGKRTFVQEIAGIVENEAAGSTKIAVKYRNNPGVTKTSTTSTAEHSLGFTPVNVDARYIGIEMTMPASAAWEKATGLQVRAVVSGET